MPAAPGPPERYDYENRRNGKANLFAFLDVRQPWRHVKVTEHQIARDFVLCMRNLRDIHYPDADLIRVVMDNLSTHNRQSYTRPSRRPRRIASFNVWSFIIHPNTPTSSSPAFAGASYGGNRNRCVTWSMPGSPHRRARSSSLNSRRGSNNAMLPVRGSNGSSPRSRRETSWHAPTPTPPKSDNHCAEVLSCSPFQAAGTENLCLFVQAVQHGRRWAKQEARS